ncbi:MAG: RNA-guided endonuclease InsQ/TnpB family protein, partial [Halobacteria archaeon]
MLETTRTYVGKIANHGQVKQDLDKCGFSASKLWNVGRHYIQERWDEDGEIPDEAELKSELKDHERYSDLHSQSSQRVLEELSEAFNGWYNSNNENDNPPGYRKRGDDHPRSTVTWKKRGIKHDDEYNRLRLSKGWNLKESRSDYILVEYETRPDVEVENVQQVRAVWNGDRWGVHIVCNKEIPVEDAPGDDVAGIDLGIDNYAAIAYGDGDTELYPGNRLKQDKHYFTRKEYQTEGENGPSERASKARKKLSRRKDHFLHTLSRHIVERCVEKGVGKIAVGDLSDIREGEGGESRNWGRDGNKKLHSWEFDRFTRLLEYKAEEYGILVERVDEEKTSKTCCCCGKIDGSNRVERGLYVCNSCETVMNADVNGAVNIRRKISRSGASLTSELRSEITQSPPSEDMSNGCLAQPSVHLFDATAGILPQEQ